MRYGCDAAAAGVVVVGDSLVLLEPRQRQEQQQQKGQKRLQCVERPCSYLQQQRWRRRQILSGICRSKVYFFLWESGFYRESLRLMHTSHGPGNVLERCTLNLLGLGWYQKY